MKTQTAPYTLTCADCGGTFTGENGVMAQALGIQNGWAREQRRVNDVTGWHWICPVHRRRR